MGEDHVATLGALRFDHSRKPREAAAPLTIGADLIGHLIDVVHQDEGDARGLCRRRASEEQRDKTDEKCGENADRRHEGTFYWGGGLSTHASRAAIAYA